MVILMKAEQLDTIFLWVNIAPFGSPESAHTVFKNNVADIYCVFHTLMNIYFGCTFVWGWISPVVPLVKQMTAMSSGRGGWGDGNIKSQTLTLNTYYD